MTIYSNKLGSSSLLEWDLRLCWLLLGRRKLCTEDIELKKVLQKWSYKAKKRESLMKEIALFCILLAGSKEFEIVLTDPTMS